MNFLTVDDRLIDVLKHPYVTDVTGFGRWRAEDLDQRAYHEIFADTVCEMATWVSKNSDKTIAEGIQHCIDNGLTYWSVQVFNDCAGAMDKQSRALLFDSIVTTADPDPLSFLIGNAYEMNESERTAAKSRLAELGGHPEDVINERERATVRSDIQQAKIDALAANRLAARKAARKAARIAAREAAAEVRRLARVEARRLARIQGRKNNITPDGA